ncbi:MAG: bifunctional phosphoglucose/phosphomannose isomerase [Aigarchaeota archaeon]|nr:bifunctional phosphoglucose/phosphomannose isomerase [Aigarchaeota archaeon]
MNEHEILENLDKIREIDVHDLLRAQQSFPGFLEEALELSKQIKIPRTKSRGNLRLKYRKPLNVVVAGMGGSAIAGDVAKDWLRDKLPIPMEVCRSYDLPVYAGPKTLVIVESYSGNTEEAIGCLLEALRRRCMVFAVTSGGSLLRISLELGIPSLQIPPKVPAPRASLPFLLVPVAVLLSKFDLISPRFVSSEIRSAAYLLKELVEEFRPEVGVEVNQAKQLALGLVDTVPIVYAPESLRSAALRFKTQLNENSKVLAKYDIFPELNHNEAIGWDAPRRLTSIFTVLLISREQEREEMKERMRVVKDEFLATKASGVVEVKARGKSVLQQLLSSIYVGDMTSFYLAVLYHVDPVSTKVFRLVKQGVEERLNVISRLEEQIRSVVR